MSAPADDRNRLGRSIAVRYSRVGAASRGGAVPEIGSLGLATSRFAAEVGRSLSVRRSVRAPEVLRPAGSSAEPAPPRWWHGGTTDGLGPRGLPRQAPVLGQPGRIARSLEGRAVPVRPPADVQAAGSMLVGRERERPQTPTSTEPFRLTGPPPARSPGKPSGGGTTAGAPSSGDVRRALAPPAGSSSSTAAPSLLGPDALARSASADLRRRVAEAAAARAPAPVRRSPVPGPARLPGAAAVAPAGGSAPSTPAAAADRGGNAGPAVGPAGGATERPVPPRPEVSASAAGARPPVPSAVPGPAADASVRWSRADVSAPVRRAYVRPPGGDGPVVRRALAEPVPSAARGLPTARRAWRSRGNATMAGTASATTAGVPAAPGATLPTGSTPVTHAPPPSGPRNGPSTTGVTVPDGGTAANGPATTRGRAPVTGLPGSSGQGSAAVDAPAPGRPPVAAASPTGPVGNAGAFAHEGGLARLRRMTEAGRALPPSTTPAVQHTAPPAGMTGHGAAASLGVARRRAASLPWAIAALAAVPGASPSGFASPVRRSLVPAGRPVGQPDLARARTDLRGPGLVRPLRRTVTGLGEGPARTGPPGAVVAGAVPVRAAPTGARPASAVTAGIGSAGLVAAAAGGATGASSPVRRRTAGAGVRALARSVADHRGQVRSGAVPPLRRALARIDDLVPSTTGRRPAPPVGAGASVPYRTSGTGPGAAPGPSGASALSGSSESGLSSESALSSESELTAGPGYSRSPAGPAAHAARPAPAEAVRRSPAAAGASSAGGAGAGLTTSGRMGAAGGAGAAVVRAEAAGAAVVRAEAAGAAVVRAEVAGPGGSGSWRAGLEAAGSSRAGPGGAPAAPPAVPGAAAAAGGVVRRRSRGLVRSLVPGPALRPAQDLGGPRPGPAAGSPAAGSSAGSAGQGRDGPLRRSPAPAGSAAAASRPGSFARQQRAGSVLVGVPGTQELAVAPPTAAPGPAPAPGGQPAPVRRKRGSSVVANGESLVQRTAQLFADRAATEVGGGSGLPSGFVPPAPLVLRRRDPSAGPSALAAPAVAELGPGVENSRPDMQELVDRVVEALEQRVVDELERRGRRNLRGGF